MLQINMEDVLKIVKLCMPFLIGLAVVIVIAAIVMVMCRKRKAALRYVIWRNSLMAILLAFVVVVNLICWGPMSNMITLATGSGTISQETSDEATVLCTQIAEEGIVLLKNDKDLLPLKNDSNLNVFGWASTIHAMGELDLDLCPTHMIRYLCFRGLKMLVLTLITNFQTFTQHIVQTAQA